MRRLMPQNRSLTNSFVSKDDGADLIVAGAYGHSRLGEKLFGGVTRNLFR